MSQTSFEVVVGDSNWESRWKRMMAEMDHLIGIYETRGMANKINNYALLKKMRKRFKIIENDYDLKEG